VSFLFDEVGLRPGQLVLDAGCGPGRHSRALAARGVRVVGIDIADRFLDLARSAPTPAGPAPSGAEPATRFVRADIVRPPFRHGAFDAVLCFCQSGFGLLGGGADEQDAFAALVGGLRPGGTLALTAFSAFYALRWLQEGDSFDPETGVHVEHATVKSESGAEERTYELATTCFTPRELRLMSEASGLRVEGIWSVEPGRWARRGPVVDMPEWLLVAHKPGDTLDFPHV
ncbi:MAG TPA: class I SAM-dependent methyltransferase, partial [Acidimicrobiales bacterium]|nr:class I SAM-dependent methyltransferase [Acidimicrobiales bacterium]